MRRATPATSDGGETATLTLEARGERRTYDVDSLTDVALRVFARKGYDGASMDDVAAEAGITKASIYHHVAGKEALLQRGLGRALDALGAILDEPPVRVGAAIDRLRALVTRVAETSVSMLAELSVLVRVRGNSTTEHDALARRRHFDRVVADLVREAQRDGTIRRDVDARLVTRLAFGMSNSVVEWYRSGGEIGGDEIVRAIVALIFDGLVPRTPNR